MSFTEHAHTEGNLSLSAVLQEKPTLALSMFMNPRLDKITGR
jgi:hypothetical protein